MTIENDSAGLHDPITNNIVNPAVAEPMGEPKILELSVAEEELGQLKKQGVPFVITSQTGCGEGEVSFYTIRIVY